jgi:hypothetical protein
VIELARCDYITRNENIIAVGNSGTGKTHKLFRGEHFNFLKCAMARLFFSLAKGYPEGTRHFSIWDS